MDSNNLIKNTLAEIEKKHIKPEPKSKYLLKKYSRWGMFSAVALAAALVGAVMYDLLSQLDWSTYQFSHANFFSYALSLLPYLWVVIFIILAGLAFWVIRKTNSGYRFGRMQIILIVGGAILAAGTVLAVSNFGGNLNSAMVQDFPNYARMVPTKESQWSQPQSGLLSGTIENVQGNIITLQDFQGQEWQVDLDQNTLVRPTADMQAGELIKIIGTVSGQNIFKATEIRPWGGMGSMMQNMMGSGGGCATGGDVCQLPGGNINGDGPQGPAQGNGYGPEGNGPRGMMQGGGMMGR